MIVDIGENLENEWMESFILSLFDVIELSGIIRVNVENLVLFVSR